MSDKSDPPLTNDDINEIIAVLDNSPYDSLELSTGRYKLTIHREGDGWTRETETLTQANVATGASAETEPAKETKAESTAADDGLVNVTAPMMGTFYRAPKPGADPYVEVGSRVKNDTVIAIIEVMKLMNSIRAETSGEVVEVCIENGQAVEQGQTLLRIKSDS